MKTKIIRIFEHSFLAIEKGKFEQRHFVALSKLNALHKDKYFDLRHNGIKFKHYVGVIQVDGLTIEILPKIDNDGRSEAVWQKALIEMIKVTRKLKIQKIGEANVNKQSIHLLDIYFEWFLSEVQTLIHQGLIKQYYKETNNVKALKGKLEFAGHISKNLVHKERFYTTHQVYDKDHLVHQILAQALDIIASLTKGNYLYNKCRTVQLDFPEVKSIKADSETFKKISKSRKTAPYETALSIARLIILNYAPNVSSGSEKMLALLFDMNSLWEEYILVRLKQTDNDLFRVTGQQSKSFWNGINIRPDIVIENGKEIFVIDTKWKNIDYSRPSTHDLRQMYVYNEYWGASKAMLLYPSNSNNCNKFIKYEDTKIDKYALINDSHELSEQHQCSVGTISIFDNDNLLDDSIGNKILNWFM